MAHHCKHAIVRDVGQVMVIEMTRADLIDQDFVDELTIDLNAVIDCVEGTPQVVISLERVQFLSSYTIGMLIALKERINDRGGTLRLADVNVNVKEVFRLTRLADVIPIDENTAKAVEQMS